MANTIRHKRGTTTPGAGSLVTGELAINTATGDVFTKTDGGSVVSVSPTAIAGKADLAGATFTGKINTPAATTAQAFLNLLPGTNPTTPVNGDVWMTSGSLNARINGGTYSYVTAESVQTITGNKTFTNSTLVFGNSVSASTTSIGSGATTTGLTKTVNIGTAGASGSTTAINLGSAVSGATSTINLNGTTNFAAGAKATHSHSATTAGLNVGPVAGDPSAPANGDVWHNGTTFKLSARINGATQNLATEAYVTANAGATYATVAQSRAGTSTTVAQNPSMSLWQSMNPGMVDISRAALTYTATGTMGTSGQGFLTGRMTMGTAGVAGANFRTFGASQIDQAWALMSKGYRSYIDFSKFTWCSGRFYMENAPVDPLVTAAFYYGKANTSANGDLARAGFGWKLTGNATASLRNVVLQVHNGTTLTNVTSSFAIVAQVYFDWDIISLGNGTVTLYINGSQVATTSAGPSADTSYSGTSPVIWNEEFYCTGTTLGYDAVFGRGRIYVAS